MASDHVAAIKSNFHPTVPTVDIPVIHVIVGDDRSSTRGADHHDLVGEYRNAVFDQDLGRAPRKADIIAGAAMDRPDDVVDKHTFQLHAEGEVDVEAVIKRQRILDILRPAIGAPLEFDIAIVAVRYRQVLDTDIPYVRPLPVVKLGLMANPV